MNIPHIDWEDSGYAPDLHTLVHLLQLDSPLTAEQMEGLRERIDPLQPSESPGMDIFLNSRICGKFAGMHTDTRKLVNSHEILHNLDLCFFQDKHDVCHHVFTVFDSLHKSQLENRKLSAHSLLDVISRGQ